VPQLWGTIIGFTALYGALAVVEVRLILYAIKKGPFHEQETFSAPAPEAPATPVAAPAVA
jgi:cytochrome d ubiquinol oxidase subunit I